MLQRMIGAALFNAHTYEEVEADQSALGQAIGVVILVTICGVIGGLVGGIIGDATAKDIILGLCYGLAFGIVRWALWVTVILMVGGGLLRSSGTQTSWSEVGRVLGFAYTPGVLAIFSWVPGVGWLFSVAAFFWTMAAAVMGVRQAMDFEGTGRAILVVVIAGVIGFIPWIILGIIQWLLLN
ncbi:hypothetical protein GBAR_LOCUS5212 [Geodia barretti]|uniref:Protein YIPF n=1 Tax=Geodia barretti TaxID=519541 RepID=A0AA35R9Q6_GEOBA|nr:hypothetical protein GBAR_LOCUS5212 [Geodia barretti]